MAKTSSSGSTASVAGVVLLTMCFAALALAQGYAGELTDAGSELTFKEKGHRHVINKEASGPAVPVLFVQNNGQRPAEVKYTAIAGSISVDFMDKGLVMSVSNGKGKHGTVEMTFGAETTPKTVRAAPVGYQAAGAKTNFLVGPADQHVASVPSFNGVKYAAAFPGVDAYWKSVGGKIKSEFHVAPQADAEAVVLHYKGMRKLHLNGHGALVLKTHAGKIVDAVPYVYQVDAAGKRTKVQGGYRLIGDGDVGFWVGEYDKTRELVIDPLLGWSSYLGGEFSEEVGNNIVITSTGDYVIAGWTDSLNLPVPKGGYQTEVSRDPIQRGDAFIARISPDGYSIKAMTYLGGLRSDVARSVKVDNEGAVWVMGSTASEDFPSVGTPLPHDNSTASESGVCDVFVAKLTAMLDKVAYSSRLGGSKCDDGFGMALDPLGAMYLVGTTESPDFPVTKNALQRNHGGGRSDVFVARVAPIAGLTASTYLGGPLNDEAVAVVLVDQHVYIAGSTEGQFPIPGHITLNKEYHGGRWDAFLARADRFLTLLGSAQYIGGAGIDNTATLHASKERNQVIVVGNTASTDIVTVRPLQPKFGGGSKDVFVDCLNLEMTEHLYTTYLGGAAEDTASDVATDRYGNLFITGLTNSEDFPMKGNPIETTRGEWEAFVTVFNGNGTDLLDSFTYGSARWTSGKAIDVSPDGRLVVLAGETRNAILHTTPNVFQPLFGGEVDAFVATVIMHDACSNACQHGLLDKVSCECHCVAPWVGPTCEVCEKTCAPHLWLDQGNCTCRECHCSGHGTCSKLTGDCKCGLAWAGPACENIICPGNCTGHGRCLDGRCDCSMGYYGERCSFKTCPKDCSGKGSCVDGQCVCAPGFSGEDCGLAFTECPKNCTENGACVLRDGRMQCSCLAGWIGEDCATRSFPCPSNCTAHGTCDDKSGRCHCEIGWAGADCNSCNAWCGNGGVRDDNNCECSCAQPWQGPSCLFCPITKCEGGATLNAKTCKCECAAANGVPSADCEAPAESRDLNSHTGTGRRCDHDERCEDKPTGAFSAVDRVCGRQCIACNESHVANPFSRMNSKNCVDFCGQMCHPICSKAGPTAKDLELCDGCVQGCVLHCPAVAKHRSDLARQEEKAQKEVAEASNPTELTEAITPAAHIGKIARASLNKAVSLAEWKKSYIKREIETKEAAMKKALETMEKQEIAKVDKVLRKHTKEILKNQKAVHGMTYLEENEGVEVEAGQQSDRHRAMHAAETVPVGSLMRGVGYKAARLVLGGSQDLHEIAPVIVEDLSASLQDNAGDATAAVTAEQAAPEVGSPVEAPAGAPPPTLGRTGTPAPAAVEEPSVEQAAAPEPEVTASQSASNDEQVSEAEPAADHSVELTDHRVLEANREEAVRTGFAQLPLETQVGDEALSNQNRTFHVVATTEPAVDVTKLVKYSDFECAAANICDDVCTYSASEAVHSCVTGCASICVGVRKCELGGAGDLGCTGCTSQCVDGCLQAEPEANQSGAGLLL